VTDEEPELVTASLFDSVSDEELAEAIAREVDAETTAERETTLAVARAKLAEAPRPRALTWREAEQRLAGKSHRHTPDGSLRDAINFAHHFQCVTCRRHRAELDPGQELELGHALSVREGRILAELLGTTEPILATRFDEDLLPECPKCNGFRSERSFSPAEYFLACRTVTQSDRPMDAGRFRVVYRYLCIVEQRRDG
jgi:hypothetical protein